MSKWGLYINFQVSVRREYITAPQHDHSSRSNFKEGDESLTAVASSSKFLSLPAEIRLYIYKLLMRIPPELPPGVRLRSRTSVSPSSALNILQTCRQINSEAEDIFYSINRLYVAHASTFLRTLGPVRRDSITKLSVMVSQAVDALGAVQMLSHVRNLRELWFVRTLSVRFIEPKTWAILVRQIVAEIEQHGKLEDVKIITPGVAGDISLDESDRLDKLREIDRKIEGAVVKR